MSEILPPCEEVAASPSQEEGIVSYNMLLYRQRQEAHLSRRRFAKRFKILPFRYRLIENGYILPSKKEAKRIGEALHMDFEAILEGPGSFPEELPEKKRNRITAWFYHLLSAKWLRISLASIVLVSSGFLIAGNAVVNYHESHQEAFFSADYVSFCTTLRDTGSPAMSLLGEWGAPEISKKATLEDGESLTIVRGSKSSYLTYVTFLEHKWTNDYRLSFDYYGEMGPGDKTFHVSACDYTYNDLYRGYAFFQNGQALIYFVTLNGSPYDSTTWERADRATWLEGLIDSYLASNDLEQHWLSLIQEKLGITYTNIQESILGPRSDGMKARSSATTFWTMAMAFSFIITLVSIFALVFALIYGEKTKKNRVEFAHSDELLGFESYRAPPKKNWRFGPFLPETFFEIAGILLVAIGAARVLAYAVMIISPGSYSSDAWSTVPNVLLGFYFLGMFMLYFIDFDLFLDDSRVLRNLTYNFLIFVGLYVIEASVMSALKQSSSLTIATIGNISSSFIPNNFMSITCYFLVMYFLFFTPKILKTKRGLILFRSMAALPILYTFVSFVIGNGDIFFGWEMNIWVQYWFRVERLPYSILCFGYLVGLFFLRLLAKKHFGEEGAKRYFLGNRFLFAKNIMLCLIVLIVWVVEICLQGKTDLNRMGIGVNTSLIVILPFMLFYHPHKGPRNHLVDYLTLGLYAIALTWSYVVAAIAVLNSGVLIGFLV